MLTADRGNVFQLFLCRENRCHNLIRRMSRAVLVDTSDDLGKPHATEAVRSGRSRPPAVNREQALRAWKSVGGWSALPRLCEGCTNKASPASLWQRGEVSIPPPRP